MSPRLSIVIPTCRRPDSLDRLLGSLEKQLLPKNEWEILVVMNLPEDESVLRRWEARLPLRWTATGRSGVNLARNCGVQGTSGSVVLFLDDDTEAVDVSLLEKHLRFHAAKAATDGLGGIYELAPGAGDYSLAYHLVAMAWLHRHTSGDGSAPHLLGGHASYKRRVFESGFCFDDKIEFGGAETEFNWRLHRAGRKLHLAFDLSVRHHLDISLRDLLRKAYLQGRHTYRRKRDLGAAPSVLSAGDALDRAVKGERPGRCAASRVKAGLLLYPIAFQFGWDDAAGKAGAPGKLFSRLLSIR